MAPTAAARNCPTSSRRRVGRLAAAAAATAAVSALMATLLPGLAVALQSSAVAPPPSGLSLPLTVQKRPVVIAHRGASGAMPEHTAAAYKLGIAEGADFIECDVQLTADMQMICRHDQNLNETTDALEKFPDRIKTHTIDGEESTGVHAIDMTLAELRTLRAKQRFPFRSADFNGKYPLVTFSEFLEIAQKAPRVVGVYPEVKHPSWHNTLPQLKAANTTIQAVVVATLHAHGYGGGPHGSAAWSARPVFLQSFELSSLRDVAATTQIPLVLLLGGWPGYRAPDSGLTHEEMTTPEALADAARVVSGVGPWKGSLWTVEETGSASDSSSTTTSSSSTSTSSSSTSTSSSSDSSSDSDSGLSADAAFDASLGAATAAKSAPARLVSTGLVARLHALGLQVHPYTLRDEPRFVPSALEGSVEAELSALFEGEGVDGVFADYPGTAVRWIKAHSRAAEQAEAGLPAAAGSSAAPWLSRVTAVLSALVTPITPATAAV